MRNRGISKVNEQMLAAVEEDPASRIWCEVCATDDHIFIERARWRRRGGTGFWDIDYTCTKCDSFYGHAVKDADVTPALMAAMAVAENGVAAGPETQS
jgi:hypothetical protein